MDNKNNKLHEEILKFVIQKTNDPSETCTALGRALVLAIVATIEYSGYDEDTVNAALYNLDKMKEVTLTLINKTK